MIEYTARITSQDTPRVGGRNLIIKGDKEKGTIGSYVAYYLHTPIDKAEPFTLSFDVLSVDRPPIGDRFLVIFMYKTRFQTNVYTKYEEGRVRYSCIIDTKDRESYDNGFKANAVYIYPNNNYVNPSNPDAGVFTIANVKLERGTVATDWTPAPEDVAESVSTVNTSLVSLASQLDSHKTATDKNFEDLATHPLTIDQDGYWQVWSVKDSKYLTTQYQSRGDKGEDAGRYLGRAKRIHPDFNGNYLLEPEGSSWQTAKEGDYVYLVGDLSNRGGDKDTYYIVREHKSKTVWEVYNIKGRTAHIEWHGTSLVVDDQPPVDLRGEAGHSPTPEEVLGTSRFAELLGGEVTSKVTPLSKEIDKSSKYAVDLINEAQLQLCDLQVLGMSDGGVIEVKRQVACCHYDYPERKVGTDSTPTIPKPKYVRAQIPLTLRSSHDALSRQVSNLQMQLTSYIQQFNRTKDELAQLKADTAITPVLNADTRKRGSTLYPKYGDWLLTSDSQEQYISFSGLPASIGKSIYIQTRRKAYLNANGHTFYGLPGTDSSIAVNQWLASNTTYRFLRADATSWLVTASSSPYPWT